MYKNNAEHTVPLLTKNISSWLSYSVLVEVNCSKQIPQFVPNKSERKFVFHDSLRVYCIY